MNNKCSFNLVESRQYTLRYRNIYFDRDFVGSIISVRCNQISELSNVTSLYYIYSFSISWNCSNVAWKLRSVMRFRR